MSKRLTVLFLLMFYSRVSCAEERTSRTSQEFPAEATTSIDALFSRFKGSVPGCSLGVFEHAGRRYLTGYGLQDVDRHVPITPKSVFAIASVSKQFTAMAVLLLVREQKLSLDESIRRTIPELPANYDPVTLRQLLFHTSGLPEYEDVYNQQGGPDYDSATRAEQLEAVVKSEGGRSPPGSAWRYANTNYLLAAIAVERASGQSLADFAHDRIFGPLKMSESAYVTSASDMRKFRAIPYQANGDGNFSAALYATHPGPTGVQTNVIDLERWAENFYLPKVGDLDLVAQMQAPGALDDGTPINFAMGLEHKRLGEHDAILHAGVTVGTRAAFVRFPAHKVTVALLCNRMDVNTERLATQIADVLFN